MLAAVVLVVLLRWAINQQVQGTIQVTKSFLGTEVGDVLFVRLLAFEDLVVVTHSKCIKNNPFFRCQGLGCHLLMKRQQLLKRTVKLRVISLKLRELIRMIVMTGMNENARNVRRIVATE